MTPRPPAEPQPPPQWRGFSFHAPDPLPPLPPGLSRTIKRNRSAGLKGPWWTLLSLHPRVTEGTHHGLLDDLAHTATLGGVHPSHLKAGTREALFYLRGLLYQSPLFVGFALHPRFLCPPALWPPLTRSILGHPEAPSPTLLARYLFKAGISARVQPDSEDPTFLLGWSILHYFLLGFPLRALSWQVGGALGEHFSEERADALMGLALRHAAQAHAKLGLWLYPVDPTPVSTDPTEVTMLRGVMLDQPTPRDKRYAVLSKVRRFWLYHPHFEAVRRGAGLPFIQGAHTTLAPSPFLFADPDERRGSEDPLDRWRADSRAGIVHLGRGRFDPARWLPAPLYINVSPAWNEDRGWFVGMEDKALHPTTNLYVRGHGWVERGARPSGPLPLRCPPSGD